MEKLYSIIRTKYVINDHKFCSDSKYADPFALEDQLKRSRAPDSEPSEAVRMLLNPKRQGGFNPSSELSKVNKALETNLLNDLDRYKEERQKIKLKRIEEEADFMSQLEILEQKKADEIKAKFEKTQIRHAIKNLEKDKIDALQNEKHLELERLEAKRKMMKEDEDKLLREIQTLEGNQIQINQIYETERNKVNKIGDQIRQKRDENDNAKKNLYQEKADRVAYLKAKREALNVEKDLLDDMMTKGSDPENTRNVLRKIQHNSDMIKGEMEGLVNYNADNMKGDQRPSSKRTFQNAASMSQKNFNIPNNGGGNQNDVNYPQNHQQQNFEQIPQNPFRRQEEYPSHQDDKKYRMLMDEIERLKGTVAQITSSNAYVPPKNQGVQQPPPMSLRAPPPQYPVEVENSYVSQNSGKRGEYQDNDKSNYSSNQQNNYPANPRQMQIYDPYKPKDFDDFLTQNFMQNQMKNVDLNEDERALVHISMMEADSLRMLARIQPGTDLYRFKVEQYKELSTQRAEVEKLVQEQRLRKMKRGFEIATREQDRDYTNQKFIDDQKKLSIDLQLRKKHGLPIITEQYPTMNDLITDAKVNNPHAQTPDVGGELGYKPELGFTVHFDYIFGLPQSSKFAQLIFAVSNNTGMVLDPQLVGPQNCEKETTSTNQCVIYQNRQIREIVPDAGTNFIIEVQLPETYDDPRNYKSFGWTFINLFDGALKLNRGKFKLPLYKPPIFTNITPSKVDELEPVKAGLMLFRISYPWKDEFSNLRNLEPNMNQGEFVIPSLHLNQARKPGVLNRDVEDEYGPSNPNYSNPPPVNYNRVPTEHSRRTGSSNSTYISRPTEIATPHGMIARSKGIKVSYLVVDAR